MTQGAALIKAISTDAVIVDKGCDYDQLVNAIQAPGIQAITPSRSNRNIQRKIDWHQYKARNLIERFFNRLKQFRRTASRYDSDSTPFSILFVPIFGYYEHGLIIATSKIYLIFLFKYKSKIKNKINSQLSLSGRLVKVHKTADQGQILLKKLSHRHALR